MKKFLVVCVAALLPCFLVSAQEADDAGTGVGLSVIPRIDLTPEFYPDGGHSFTLGNSSLYSLFEGNISESVSFSVANHWAGFYSTEKALLFEDTKALYKNTLKRTGNWLDWANVTFTTGNFSFTLGKDMVTMGGIEFDDYDFDIDPILVSSLWNGFDCYQWGAKVGYSLSDSQELTFQVTTSPYADGLFEKPWFNYSLGWNGSVGDIETIWSATAIQTGAKEFFYLASLGQRLEAGNWLLGLDLSNASMMTGDLSYGLMVLPSVTYNFSDGLNIFAKGGYEALFKGEDAASAFWGGAGVNWYPVENLRLRAFGAYNQLWECSSVGIGLTYFLNIGK